MLFPIGPIGPSYRAGAAIGGVCL